MENNFNIEEDIDKDIDEDNSIFKKIFELYPDAIVIINTQGQIVCINKSTEKMFGYSSDELVGKTIENLIPVRFREKHIQDRERFFKEPRMRPIGTCLDLYGLRKDNSEFSVDIMLSPIKERELLVLAAIRDVTQRKKTENELNEIRKNLEIKVGERTSELTKTNVSLQEEISLREHLENSLKNYTQTLENITHIADLYKDIIHYNIIGPLTDIKTISEKLKEENLKLENESLLSSILTIERNTDNIIEIVKRTDNYVNLKVAGKLSKSMQDLDKILRSVIISLKSNIDQKNLKFNYLGKTESYAMVNPIIEDAFFNLIRIIIKLSPTESKIESNIIEDKDFYKIYIKNDYVINDEDKVKFFTSSKNGIDMILANNIAILHGGNIWIEDNPEGGSVFFVKIPKI